MSSGVGIPFNLTGGARTKVSCGRFDFNRVVSSHVRPSGNFVINRAAMLTLSPITGDKRSLLLDVLTGCTVHVVENANH